MNEQNRRILELLSEGKALKQIKPVVFLSIPAIEKRIFKMKKMHNCGTRMELVVKFVNGDPVYMV